jgi:hypothetical protein|eukprot:COSAG06_NODE_4842_length_3915_cov_2.264413_4_plen_69_part_00
MKHDDRFTKTGSGHTRGNISTAVSIEEKRVCFCFRAERIDEKQSYEFNDADESCSAKVGRQIYVYDRP